LEESTTTVTSGSLLTSTGCGSKSLEICKNWALPKEVGQSSPLPSCQQTAHYTATAM